MHIPHAAWIVVADGEKYLLLRNRGDGDLIDLRVIGRDEIANPPTRAQGSDKPGRFDDAGPGKSAVQDTDWHALEKERFAEDLGEKLRHWALEGRFDDLVVVCDPGTLGVLRKTYHKAVRNRLAGEVDKDLAHHPLDAIERAIARA